MRVGRCWLGFPGWALAGLSACQVSPTAGATELRVDSEPKLPAPLEMREPETAAAPSAPAAAKAPCPEEMALVGSACVDRYEAHLVVRRDDGSFERHPEYQRPEEGVRYEARSERGVKPQAYISSLEAQAACENAGKRLCSLEEWTTACRGPDNSTYPYGSSFDRDKCNMGHKHILAELHGKDPMVWTYDHFNDPELIKQGSLSPAGAFDQCTNAFGAYDMVGNLHEWVGDRVSASLPSRVPLPKKIERTVKRKRGNGIFMGGFFSTFAQHGNGCEFITIAHEPKYHDYSTGFRCCRDREP